MLRDFYQHTFDTSHDGNVNSTLHDDITRYEARFDAAGFAVDRDTLNRHGVAQQQCASLSPGN
jgi:hypothetical protein